MQKVKRTGLTLAEASELLNCQEIKEMNNNEEDK
ncbi:hypothetical protein L362_04650 [Enterobacter sp. MGH 16]|jgi:hypothetical protein|nr:hypothetical protein L362_04650 [Enterobacter sp. MGH 16]CZY27117.1 Uncharacterised protein [Enterobacter hormaechei]